MLKCLEKRPVRRYSSASELVADLQRFLDGRSVHARPIPVWEHAGKWARRRPVHAALSFVLVAGVLAVLGASRGRRQRRKAARRPVIARPGESEARDQLRLADQQRLLTGQHLAASQLRLAAALVEREEYDPAMAILESISPPQNLPDSRGFAWYYLDRLISPRVQMLPATARDGQSRCP